MANVKNTIENLVFIIMVFVVIGSGVYVLTNKARDIEVEREKAISNGRLIKINENALAENVGELGGCTVWLVTNKNKRYGNYLTICK